MLGPPVRGLRRRETQTRNGIQLDARQQKRSRSASTRGVRAAEANAKERWLPRKGYPLGYAAGRGGRRVQ